MRKLILGAPKGPTASQIGPDKLGERGGPLHPDSDYMELEILYEGNEGQDGITETERKPAGERTKTTLGWKRWGSVHRITGHVPALPLQRQRRKCRSFRPRSTRPTQLHHHRAPGSARRTSTAVTIAAASGETDRQGGREEGRGLGQEGIWATCDRGLSPETLSEVALAPNVQTKSWSRASHQNNRQDRAPLGEH